jgi:hypothetical protein
MDSSTITITTLVVAGKLRVGDQIKCTVHGQTYRISTVVAARKAKEYVLRFEEEEQKSGNIKLITVPSPTTLVRELLPLDHPLKKKKGLKGWPYCECVRLSKSLSVLKAEVAKERSNAQLAAIDEDAPPNVLKPVPAAVDDYDSDPEAAAEDPLVEQFPVMPDPQRHKYDNAVASLQSGTGGGRFSKALQRQNLSYDHRDDSVYVCVAAGALGLDCLDDEKLLRSVRSIGTSTLHNDLDKHSMELGLYPACEDQLQILATTLQVDITLLLHPMQEGHQLQHDTTTQISAAELQKRKLHKTYRAFAPDDEKNIAARHILLQTVRKMAKQTKEHPLLVVDLVTLSSDDTYDTAMNEEETAVAQHSDIAVAPLQQAEEQSWWPAGIPQAVGGHRNYDEDDGQYYIVKYDKDDIVCSVEMRDGNFNPPWLQEVARRPKKGSSRELEPIASSRLSSAPLSRTGSMGSSSNIGGNSSAAAATSDRYCRRIQQQMHELRLEAWTTLNTLSSSQDRVAAVEAGTNLTSINAVLSSTSEQLLNAQTIDIFLAGYTKAGTINITILYRTSMTRPRH